MDMVKIGQFLSELRRGQGLTQEQLGEELGVTNKTVSRWETGAYLPPVEMLQLLSQKYGITINEILSGERLNAEGYKEKAEENIASALENSAFTLKEKQLFFEKKWRKEHLFEMIVEMLFLIALAVYGAAHDGLLCLLVSLLCILWAGYTRNRMAAYVENHLYGNMPDKTKKE